VKVLTAGASAATAIAFAPLVPKAAGAIQLYHEAFSKSEEQRVETLSKLLDTEERMRLAVESAGLGSWEHNLVTHEIFWDARCRAVLGLQGDRQPGYEDFIALVHPDDRAQVESVVGDALASNREYRAAYRVVTADGETRNVIARGKPFYDDAGKPLRVIGTVIDVTKERQAEDALVKTEKLAVAGRMAASIAHEINNPLGAAMAMVYLARNDKDVPERIKQRLESAEQELERAGRITHSTLTYYRESPTPVRTNPADLLESVLTLQQGALRRAQIQLEKNFVYTQDIDAFPGELRQVFTNLITNAIEAMPPNGRLTIRLHPAQDGKTGRDGYRIVVADNGSGIPPEARKKLFTAFYTTKGE
jgi:PAS domain S-box-containing protein